MMWKHLSPETKGFVKLKKVKKIWEKLGSGWVGQDPTRILIDNKLSLHLGKAESIQFCNQTYSVKAFQISYFMWE